MMFSWGWLEVINKKLTSCFFRGWFFIAFICLAPSLPCLESEKSESSKDNNNLFQEAAGKFLRWRLQKGEVVELRKFAEQVIKINEQPLTRNIFHRVLLEVQDELPEQGYQILGTFSSYLEIKAKAALKEEEYYTSNFVLKPTGEFIVPDHEYMPNIRHIPTFPPIDPADSENPMPVGYRWRAPGEELMQSTGVLIKIPVEVHYEYLGEETISTKDGLKNLHKIRIDYQINYKAKQPVNPLPRRIFGLVQAIWLWDSKEGIPYYSKEDYNVIMVYASGETQEYQINHRSFYRKIKPLLQEKRQQLLAELQSELQQISPPDKQPKVQADLTEQGIRITLPDILFDYNSAELTSQSREVLNKVVALLNKLPGQQVKVVGHTDNVGSDLFNQNLSQERAQVVANYLASRIKEDPERITFEGKGERQPVAPNDSEKGRARNRRVEIILLDK